LDGGFFEIAEPCPFDGQGGVEAGVSACVVGFVDAHDAVAGLFRLFDGFDDEVSGAELDDGVRVGIDASLFGKGMDVALGIDGIGGFDDITLGDLIEVGEEDVGEFMDTHVAGWVGGFG